ncbi:hypothetical protein [Echinicola sp. 20G]|uniref:hypothetical protein n=1 Tax=Echinicola sp. 20G TaxID=2781961 RepID=UPI00191030E8|nr:hypothetical protein [Echinicola sp. 20G]
MKKLLSYSLLLILTFSCNANDFSDTEMYFETDKETYSPNEKFEIIVNISPKQGEKKIRILKNFNNIKISFYTEDGNLGFSEILKDKFIEGRSLFEDESKYIDEFIISKSEPFNKAFEGSITESKKKIFFEIPELNIKDSLNKSELINNPTIIIKGNCSSVYNGIEEVFAQKEIKILID